MTEQATKQMSKPKYALVKWVNGEDKGKFSIVSSSWLKGFDPNSYSKNKDETIVVEWRDQKKPPLGGWQCFDAVVIKISDSKSMLERLITNLVGASPTTKPTPEVEKTKGYPELLGLSDGDDSDVDKNYTPSPGAFKRAEREERITPAKIRKLVSSEKNSSIVRKNMFEPISSPNKDKEIARLRKENAELKRRLLEEMPAMMKRMDEVLNKAPNNLNSSESQSPVSKPGKVEILPGTGVFVDMEAWLSAKGCQTPGAFVGRLLVNLFDKDTLLTSNLKGGASKLAPTAEKKKRLDEVKISALKGAMQTYHPGVKESQFGVFVNQKLANLRMAEKKTTTMSNMSVTDENE